MKLGLMIGYSGAQVDFPIHLVKLAEKLGYDSVWTSEAYRSDAVTPLAWIAAQTSRINLGTAIMQVAGRSPAMCAMHAMTVDGHAGGGRVIVGIGVSGPQIVEGWYGQPWGKPYWRVRDYIEIMRKMFRRDGPVWHDGREISLPYTGEGATGLGKPLRSILRPTHDIPIYLGCGTESMLRLCGELCDGVLPLRFVPTEMLRFRTHIEEGFRRAKKGKSWDNFSFEALARPCPMDAVTTSYFSANTDWSSGQDCRRDHTGIRSSGASTSTTWPPLISLPVHTSTQSPAGR